MKKVVVFSGAGVSADSGLKTFRDSDGLWEEYNVYDVATPEAWEKDQKMVLEFYNKRRKQIVEAKPNAAHIALAELEKKFDVTVITQNIDDLHQRAGSTKVLHLHGNIQYARSTNKSKNEILYPITGWELNYGDKCPDGYQLRPHVVWFGEDVPMMSKAIEVVQHADILIITGTSLTVYPAAGLVYKAPKYNEKYLVDPKPIHLTDLKNLTQINENASTGVPKLVKKLLDSY
ncbi:MAG TPA: NAD-dependent deacylase [Flavobacteriales bacterium]|nr:NAD-dependent deacylase [Flavobacteriales bacterium]